MLRVEANIWLGSFTSTNLRVRIIESWMTALIMILFKGELLCWGKRGLSHHFKNSWCIYQPQSCYCGLKKVYPQDGNTPCFYRLRLGFSPLWVPFVNAHNERHLEGPGISSPRREASSGVSTLPFPHDVCFSFSFFFLKENGAVLLNSFSHE